MRIIDLVIAGTLTYIVIIYGLPFIASMLSFLFILLIASIMWFYNNLFDIFVIFAVIIGFMVAFKWAGSSSKNS